MLTSFLILSASLAGSLCLCSPTRRGDGSNALILPATKAAGASASAAAAAGTAASTQQPLSKSQLKKLKQVQLKKERREQLSQVRLGGMLSRAAAVACSSCLAVTEPPVLCWSMTPLQTVHTWLLSAALINMRLLLST